MTRRQGRAAIATAIVVFSLLLAREAVASDNWIGFVVTEVGIVVPLAISWWVLGERPSVSSGG